MAEIKKVTVTLTAEDRSFIDKDSGSPRSFTSFCILVNNVPVPIKAWDRTGTNLLKSLFGG